MKPKLAKWWIPSAGFIEHAHESECPVSAITPRSFDLVQIVNDLRVANMAAGAAIAIEHAPGYLVDAIKQIEIESVVADRAAAEAKRR